ncbi:MAG TPA: triphosphoribosyl-dephospho-CoA synthase MdcB [Noviherbaspirillum sp.]|jgi:triphosphoribosyl-dephospho-CoA synthase|uniref:triphosphoribosyl-dephospho-CoA synthase MdcB n=1 Tax=Noviherbaspirillum sp. TaxID=1926288 RepID=UPI002DDCF5DF|nr:triphosphoribosyl-dephospho-CoA synthase MdcB [Noviherbaspirillum sp.]HEV2609735.1 triphosphoribosyl-dephospho-CoA synthase MdcB [Noviherbaspirillum sp.]
MTNGMAMVLHLPAKRLPSPLRSTVNPDRSFCVEVGRIAIASLHDELVLYPKPGLVSLVDNGSHEDMNAETFFRSLFSLRHYFVRMTEAGLRDAPFHALKALGMEAEARMLRATGGINTHRGAIFALGMLCAATGRCHGRGVSFSPPAIRQTLIGGWGTDLIAHTRHGDAGSHGVQVAKRHAVTGAREEAALGMPSVFKVALPRLQVTMATTGCWERARIEAMFALMASVSDTNVYYRGGEAGAQIVKLCGSDFLARGGTAAADWKEYAVACHRYFMEKRLSPGGAADLLGAACFVYKAVRRFG